MSSAARTSPSRMPRRPHRGWDELPRGFSHQTTAAGCHKSRPRPKPRPTPFLMHYILHIIHHLILIDLYCLWWGLKKALFLILWIPVSQVSNPKLWCNWVHKTVPTKWRVQFSDFSNFPRIRRSAALSRRALQSIKRSMNWIVFCQQAYNELQTEKIQTKITSILVKQSQHC